MSNAALMRWPAVDYFIIGGDRSPGIARLTKADSPSGIDIRKGYGLSGASTVPTGEEPSDIEFTLEFWDESIHPAQFDVFARKWLTRPVALPPGGLSALALPIIHPGINRAPVNVSKVLRHNCTALIKSDETGLYSCTVSFLQFRLPRLALSRPFAAIPPKVNPRPTAQDAADVDLEAARQTLNGLIGHRLVGQ
jgi:hypothetical protein